MATALYNNLPRLKNFVMSEASNQRSRDNIVVTQTGTAILSGTLLTRVDTGTAAFAMDAGATGNPTSGSITVGAAAMAGVNRGEEERGGVRGHGFAIGWPPGSRQGAIGEKRRILPDFARWAKFFAPLSCINRSEIYLRGILSQRRID